MQTIFDNKINKNINFHVGKDATDNWKLIDTLDSNFTWFHVSDYPSSHVILEYNYSKLKELNKQTLIHCASICKNKSKAKNIKNIEVNYTPISNLYKGEDIGSVYYKELTKIKTIIV